MLVGFAGVLLCELRLLVGREMIVLIVRRGGGLMGVRGLHVAFGGGGVL